VQDFTLALQRDRIRNCLRQPGIYTERLHRPKDAASDLKRRSKESPAMAKRIGLAYADLEMGVPGLAARSDLAEKVWAIRRSALIRRRLTAAGMLTKAPMSIAPP